jgi:dinuclear metal center YbgI/SA1388 family protein
MLRLDARLEAVKAMVKPGGVAADIGCDHGKLICGLAQDGIITRGYACDTKPGPLENAKKTIRENCLGGTVEAVLTDGLSGLPHQGIDTFIIAGMGGELIADIMLSHSWVFDTRFDFILQPMTRAGILRQRLLENGFTIEEIRTVTLGRRVYTVMRVKYTVSTLVRVVSMAYTVGDFFDAIDSIASFSTADSSDNAGLLVGSRQLEVTGALVALDATADVLKEAQELGANLIITHHPFIFSGVKQVGAESLLYKLIAAGVSVISAHTNLDAANGGVNDVLCGLLKLKDIRPLESAAYPGLARIGELPEPKSARERAALVRSVIGVPVVKYTECTLPIQTVAVCGGSGGDLMPEAVAAGAGALVTADVKHHQLIEARDTGFALMDAGHYATEVTVVRPLAKRLAAMLPGVSIASSKAQRDPAEYSINNSTFADRNRL